MDTTPNPAPPTSPPIIDVQGSLQMALARNRIVMATLKYIRDDRRMERDLDPSVVALLLDHEFVVRSGTCLAITPEGVGCLEAYYKSVEKKVLDTFFAESPDMRARIEGIAFKATRDIQDAEREHHGDPPLLLYHENLHALVKEHGYWPPFSVVPGTSVPWSSIHDGVNRPVLVSTDRKAVDFLAALLNLVCEGWE